MRKVWIVFLLAGLLGLLLGCGETEAPTADQSQTEGTVTVEDSSGRKVTVHENTEQVAALSSSLGEIWTLAGGTLTAVTSDFEEREHLDIENATIVGTVKDPNLELLLEQKPDLVILSQDIEGHLKLTNALGQAGIPYYIAKVEAFGDYLGVLRDFTKITNREDLYEKNGTEVQAQIDAALKEAKSFSGTSKSAIFMRAFSTGVKVKASEHVVCDILNELGVDNVANRGNGMTEELNMEAILAADPEYIFIVMMGSSAADAERLLESYLYSHPAWGMLSAVKEDRVVILPKALFHYKPNNRWGEAYEYMAEIIYG